MKALCKRRIRSLLNLQLSIINAINEEIEWCLLGRENDIAERIKYIVDEKRLIPLSSETKEEVE